MKLEQSAPIKISAIDTADDRYRITRSTNLELLSRSIDRVGLLNPPILESIGTRYRIVAGFGRVGACAMLGWRKIDARILEPTTTAMECLAIAIADNALARPLNIIEEAVAIAKLAAESPGNRFPVQTAAALGLPTNPQLILKYSRLCRLPKAVQDQVATEVIALTLALELENIETDSAVAISRLFELLRPTLNQQRELLDNMRDIAANEEKTLAVLIGEPAVSEVVAHDGLDRKQKIALLRDTIRKRRYPSLSQAEIDFHRHHQALALPDGLDLLAPKNFESPDYRLMVTFRTTDELQKKIEQMQRVVSHPELQSILNRDFENS